MMVCPNCHSHEIIAVQGQNFCIACGQIVPDSEPQKILAAVGAQLQPAGVQIMKGGASPAAAAAIKPAGSSKKRGVGRPRKAHMDAPITHLPPSEPSAEPAPVAVKPPPPAPAPDPLPAGPQMAEAKLRTMTDVSKAKPAPPEHNHDGSPKELKPAHRHRTPGMQASAWKALGHGQNYLQTLPFALAALLPAGIVWANLSHLAGLNLSHLHRADLGLAGQLVLAVIAAWTLGIISLSSVTFGTARRHDQRGKNSGLVWARVGAAASLKVWAVLLCQLALAVPILASLGALVRFGGQDLGLPSIVSLGAVFVMAAVAGYLLAGVAVGTMLGLAGITLGNLSVWQALHLGWNGWRRHPELLANWLAVALPALILTALWTWSLLPVDAASLSSPAWLAQAAGGLVLVILVSTAQTGAAAEAAYRHVVSTDRFGQAGNFLMGRSTKQLPKFALAPLVLTVLAAGGIAAIQLLILR